MDIFPGILLTGIAATALVDAWSLARRSLFGTPLPNYALVGRWISHMSRGHFRHASISAATSARGEAAVGWLMHYFTGIGFAFLLFAFVGIDWFENPAPAPALLFGLVTVAAPFFVMQPAMGLGIAASRTPRPATARLQSLVFHGIFGLGLYAGGLLVHYLSKGV